MDNKNEKPEFKAKPYKKEDVFVCSIQLMANGNVWDLVDFLQAKGIKARHISCVGGDTIVAIGESIVENEETE